MGRVDLVFDSSNLQFSVAIMVPRPRPGQFVAEAGPGSPTFVNAEFLVDTGSNTSAINEALALDLGILVEMLPQTPATGINGTTLEPTYQGDIELYLNENLDRTVIRDPNVYHPVARKVRQKIVGKVVKRGIAASPMPNLFGLDALKVINQVGGRLHVDMRSETAYIDW